MAHPRHFLVLTPVNTVTCLAMSRKARRCHEATSGASRSTALLSSCCQLCGYVCADICVCVDICPAATQAYLCQGKRHTEWVSTEVTLKHLHFCLNLFLVFSLYSSTSPTSALNLFVQADDDYDGSIAFLSTSSLTARGQGTTDFF